MPARAHSGRQEHLSANAQTPAHQGRKVVVISSLLLLSAPIPCSAQSSQPAPSQARGRLLRVPALPAGVSAPNIDGRLSDGAWKGAAKLPPLVERLPRHGARPSQRTEVYFLYRPDALFLGIRAYDDSPREIVAALGPRDGPPDSDRITLYLDPLLTRRRGYYFAITAAGVQLDGLFKEDLGDVTTWDGVWRSATRRTPWGWSAEIKIPLTSIGFQGSPTQSGGVYVERYLQREQRQFGWPLLPRFANNLVEHFGSLEGLAKLKRKERLRLQPYSAARIQLGSTEGTPPEFERFSPNAGLDLRYSTTAATRLILALNPDFGEVEQDPAVLNVTPNPVFFTENRPYFVAGADLFATSRATGVCGDMACYTPATLLYTRRIGAPGSLPQLTAGGTLMRRDSFPRIVTALKVLGEAGTNLSYSALSTVVAPSHAVERLADRSRIEHELTPWTHHSAIRAKYRVGEHSYLGAMATGASRHGAADGYVAGVDGVARSTNGWEAAGLLSASYAAGRSGVGGFLRAGKTGAGAWQAFIESELYSDTFDLDDLGFLTRNDLLVTQAKTSWQLARPTSGLRSLMFELLIVDVHPFSNLSLALERYGQVDLVTTFANQFTARSFIRIYAPTEDDREMRGGPPLPRPWGSRIYLEFGTNASARFSTKLYGPVVFRPDGLTWAVNSESTARLWQRLHLSLRATYFRVRGLPSFVAHDEAATRYLAGRLELDQLELQFRATLGLHRDFSLRVFFQLLYGVGRYGAVEEIFIDAQGESRFRPASYDRKQDFSRLDIIGYTALRWELGGGTAGLLVYKMASGLRDSGAHISFQLGDELSRLFSRSQDHQLLLKISYAWSI